MKSFFAVLLLVLTGASWSYALPVCVPNEKVAQAIAEAVLSGIYGSEKIENQKPLKIVETEKTWVIRGTKNTGPQVKGGTAYIEIAKKDGRVIQVLHGQ